MGTPSTDMELVGWMVDAMYANGRVIRVKTDKNI